MKKKKQLLRNDVSQKPTFREREQSYFVLFAIKDAVNLPSPMPKHIKDRLSYEMMSPFAPWKREMCMYV